MPDVRLVLLAEAHLEDSLRWLENEALREGLLVDRVITPESHRAWFVAQQSDSSQAIYAIMADGVHAGNFGFRHLNPRHATGELWMYVGTEHHGRRLAFPALRAGLQIGFSTHGLRKISLNVRTTNARAIAVYVRAGFVVEGVLLAEQVYRGRPVDLLRFAILRPMASET